MSPFTTKHKRFSLTTLRQLFFRKLSIYFIRNVASVSASVVATSLISDKVESTSNRSFSPEVAADYRYIYENGKSTDTPKQARAANPTLSLARQIEFREDCVTLPPRGSAISILVNYP